jgi:hypothetical protein
MTTAHLPQLAAPRVAPSVAAALVLYAGYLALFFTTWVVNDVDYMTIGHTAESARLHYALPTLIGSAFLVVMLTVFGWWRITLFDPQRSGPRWAWLGPLCMFCISASAFLLMRREGATPELVLWCVLGSMTSKVHQREQRQARLFQPGRATQLGQIDNGRALGDGGAQLLQQAACPAIMVPPVAIRSSISSTRSPGFTASVCSSTVALPYSSS